MPHLELGWERQKIKEIGISFDAYQPWRLDATQIGDLTLLSMELPDQVGLVFMRYGRGETVDALLEASQDLMTRVTVRSDHDIDIAGHTARRAIALEEKQRRTMYRVMPGIGPVDSVLPETRTILMVIGFTRRSVPVLIGYRILEDQLADYQPLLEHVINSVVFDD
jgi:hypothetical protein